MKVFIILCSFCLTFSLAQAEDFLGLPLPQGKVVEKTDTYIKIETLNTHDEILKFYKGVLEKEKDIKFRDWKEMTYIEDDGARPWHSINIYKGQGAHTTVQINKDKWSWIIGTLVLRYIAVFVVLMVLMLALSLSGQITGRLFEEGSKSGEK
ncbi:MAG: hypothetical protein ACK4WB_07090 [Desulfatiglandales bacterium]